MTDPAPTGFSKPPLLRGLKKPPARTEVALDASSSDSVTPGGGFSPQQAMEAFRSPPSMILPFLYLGNQANAANKKQLSQLGITRILSVKERHLASDSMEIELLSVPMSDHGDTSIADVLPDCFQFLEETRSKKMICLVHCRGGVNRSATIVLAFLMAKEGMTLKQAWDHVKAKRPSIAPVEPYIKQLREYEMQIYGKNTLEHIDTAPTLNQRIEEWRLSHRKNVSMPVLASSSTKSEEDPNCPMPMRKLERDKKSHTSPVGRIPGVCGADEPNPSCWDLSGSQDSISPSGSPKERLAPPS